MSTPCGMYLRLVVMIVVCIRLSNESGLSLMLRVHLDIKEQSSSHIYEPAGWLESIR